MFSIIFYWQYIYWRNTIHNTGVYEHIQYLIILHSKKCWGFFNPILGKIWTNPAIGLKM